MHSTEDKRAAFKLAFWLGVGVQVLIELPQLTNPLTAQFTVGTAHLELVEGSLQALVCHGRETWLVAQRAWLSISLDTLDARFTEAVPATADDVRLAEDQQTDRTFALELLRRRLDKLTLVPSLLFFSWHRSIEDDSHYRLPLRSGIYT